VLTCARESGYSWLFRPDPLVIDYFSVSSVPSVPSVADFSSCQFVQTCPQQKKPALSVAEGSKHPNGSVACNICPFCAFSRLSCFVSCPFVLTCARESGYSCLFRPDPLVIDYFSVSSVPSVAQKNRVNPC